MHAGDAVFEPPHVQVAFAEIDLIPMQINSLSHPQAVTGHDEDQRGIPLAIAALAGCLDEPVKLSLSQIAPPIAPLHGSITPLSGKSVESTLISTSGVRSAISPSMVILSAFHRLAV